MNLFLPSKRKILSHYSLRNRFGNNDPMFIGWNRGDENSKFFHSKASQRLCRKRISDIKNNNGVQYTGKAKILGFLVSYYQWLFTSSQPTDFEAVLQTVPWVVTNYMNNTLIGEFTRIEVDMALKQMAPLKAPGPNSIPPTFYQYYWQHIGNDISWAVLSFLNFGKIPCDLNYTYLTLIPKVKSPEKVIEFWHIALYNVWYKLASKVLANWLKKILPHITSNSQSAVQSDKAILDNILVAFETLHHMKTKKSRNKGFWPLLRTYFM